MALRKSTTIFSQMGLNSKNKNILNSYVSFLDFPVQVIDTFSNELYDECDYSRFYVLVPLLLKYYDMPKQHQIPSK